MAGDAPKPEPVYVVRCTARGCDWSVQSNVAKRLGQFWRWHAAWHRRPTATSVDRIEAALLAEPCDEAELFGAWLTAGKGRPA